MNMTIQFFKIILLFIFLQTLIIAQTDQNNSCNNLVQVNAKVFLLEQKLKNIESYRFNYLNDIHNIKKDYNTDIARLEKSYTTQTRMFVDQFNYAKDSMETRKTVFTYLASLVLFIVVAVFAFYGIRIYEVHNSFKDKEKGYKENLNELRTNIETKFENDIKEKEKSFEIELDNIKAEANQKIKATVKKADIEIRKYQDEINKLIDQIKNTTDYDTSEPSSNDPF